MEQLPAKLSGAAVREVEDALEGLDVPLGGLLEAAHATGDVEHLALAAEGLCDGGHGVDIIACANLKELAEVEVGQPLDGAQVGAVERAELGRHAEERRCDVTEAQRMAADRHDGRPPLTHPMRRPVLRWAAQPSRSRTPPLTDAINTPLPTRPQPARLPPSFRVSRNLAHPPPFLDNLTRATLPTSSLSPPPTVDWAHPRPSVNTVPFRAPSIVLNHVQPTDSSVDTLLRVSSRSMSTYSNSSISIQDTQAPSTLAASFSRWWFQPETLLTQEDRSESPSETKKKCPYSSLLLTSLFTLCMRTCRSISQKSSRILSRAAGF